MDEVKHYQINGKYKMQFERGATKGIDGFKVESNDDDLNKCLDEAKLLYEAAKELTSPVPSGTTTDF